MTLSARDAYRHELTQLAEHDESILCLEADLGGKSHPFQERFPKRFFNIGIAESASIDMATGLAKAGFKPFFSTFSPFAVLRSAESIKLSLGYMGANIKIIAPYAGCSGGWFGTTHHSLEDIAIVQSFPGIIIAAPYGEQETRSVIRDAVNSSQPFYIRMGRNKQYEGMSHVSIKNIVYQPDLNDRGVCLISIGEEATRICEMVIKEIPTVSHAHIVYLDYNNLKRHANNLRNKFSQFFVVEEHRVMGGVCATMSLLLPDANVIPFCVNNEWPSVGGTHDDILEYLDFTTSNLITLITTKRK